MRLLHSFIITVLFTLSFNSHAARGGWGSGGGELFDDSQNPWFLQNTRTVHYCVEIDESAMGVSRSFVLPLISKAFVFWKNQFSRSLGSENGIQLATQDFVIENKCSDKTDVKFRFGVGAAATDRSIYESFVGFVDRTRYDKKILRGRGIIYISPERGPFQMKGSNVPSRAWSYSNGFALYPVLLHEIGHLFGLSHDSGDQGIMGERFPEVIVTSGLFDEQMVKKVFFDSEPDYIEFTSTYALLNNFCLRSYYDGGITTQTLFDRFFNVPSVPGSCSYLVINNDQVLSLIFSPKNGEEIKLGEAHLHKLTQSTQTRVVSRVFLPAKQTIFSNKPSGQQLTAAEGEELAVFKGKYLSVNNSVERSIGIQVKPWGVPTISGVLNDQLFTDLSSEQ